jgi:hypothetical protein
MAKCICYGCGAEMEYSYSSFRCNVCRQTEIMARAMKKQAEISSRQSLSVYLAPPMYAPSPSDDNWRYEPSSEYVEPSPEEKATQKEIKRIDKLFSLGVDLSIFVAWGIIWMITSGWVTFFSFIAAGALPYYLETKHRAWRWKNAKYLYQM